MTFCLCVRLDTQDWLTSHYLSVLQKKKKNSCDGYHSSLPVFSFVPHGALKTVVYQAQRDEKWCFKFWSFPYIVLEYTGHVGIHMHACFCLLGSFFQIERNFILKLKCYNVFIMYYKNPQLSLSFIGTKIVLCFMLLFFFHLVVSRQCCFVRVGVPCGITACKPVFPPQWMSIHGCSATLPCPCLHSPPVTTNDHFITTPSTIKKKNACI